MHDASECQKGSAHEGATRGGSPAGWKGHISELVFHFFLRTFFLFLIFFSLASSSHNKICPCKEVSSKVTTFFRLNFKLAKRPRLLQT